MAHRIFVTATNTDIGKTYTTLTLLRHYAAAGYRVGAFKPIETGVLEKPLDGSALLRTLRDLNPEFQDVTVEEIVPLRFALPAAPYVAGGALPIDFDAIDRALTRIEERCDVVIIEGAGGLMVPLDADTFIRDLIVRYKAKALLVAHCRLGCINDLLLNMMALEAAHIPYEWVLNCREASETFERISAPYLDARFPGHFRLDRSLDTLAARLLPRDGL